MDDAPKPRLSEEAEPFIPYVDEADYPENLRPILEPYMKRMGFVPNALKLYMHRPEISEPLWILNSKIMRDPSSTLDQFLKRKLAAVACRINGCTYCTSHCCSMLRKPQEANAEGWGMDDLEVRNLLTGDAEPADDFERACFDYVRAASSDPANVPDAVLDNLKAHLTPAQIVELACVVGFWKMYNTIHDSLHIPLEEALLDASGYVDV
ncbi:MAG: hypothetical protein QF393_03375 [Rhodospirillales bacterium]|jgi:uncharacterized peroxidase-related enzyme|nr:hypothetical protein [Rhodospirillaceae bacterium]MDP6427035.1 hypothetical protein [Rhodospirillales bacterium]MDP6646626.1 hypothetical protein [Rhodospirillales bacterium]|tara:strand:- start:458 stop:1084 length:627 start_codon:yes stop_codon:yes gene_type:complete